MYIGKCVNMKTVNFVYMYMRLRFACIYVYMFKKNAKMNLCRQICVNVYICVVFHALAGPAVDRFGDRDTKCEPSVNSQWLPGYAELLLRWPGRATERTNSQKCTKTN